MADTKPFVCNSPGCTMSFINEDHLMVHKKKHDMTLNFGAGGKIGVFIADETPTPTRFIRNCEEVGLFQDLQNVNPFEETFRIAVETGKTGGGLSGSDININDDTLHTPHVFPHNIEAVQSVNRVHVDSLTSSSSANGSTTIIVSETLKNVDVKHGKMVLNTCNLTEENDTSFKRMGKNADGILNEQVNASQQVLSALPPTILSGNGGEVQYFIKSEDGKLTEMKVIPISNQLNSIKSIKKGINTGERQIDRENCEILQSTMVSSSLSFAKMRLKHSLTSNGKCTDTIPQAVKKEMKKNEEKKNESIDLRKIKEIRARNRASSMRARARRKDWIKGLQESVVSANEVNAALQEEIKALRSEVAKLKMLLSAHKDCQVTKSMEKSNDNTVSLPNELLIPTIVSSDDSITTGIKRINNNNNNVDDNTTVKRKKPSILLPKVKSNNYNNNLPVITEKIIDDKDQQPQQLKIINLNQLNTHSNLDKPIFILPNNNILQKNIQIINSKHIINVDQSLQLINVASKSTGT